MTQTNEPSSQGQSPADEAGQSNEPTQGMSRLNIPSSGWYRVRWFGLRAAALVGAAILLGVIMFAGAGVYTSRPEFCRSCHNMEPYYISWKTSSHKHVSCIKCHFPPGLGEKVRGKMLGLVQLAKYVTRTEGPRPAAEVPDESCLRSGCHDTRTLSGRVEFHGLAFDHRPHLLEERRGMKLRCTSCHSQIVQGQHMTVTTTTCFLCHFKNEHFNEGLGSCTRCHQIPEQNFDLGGGVTFHHDLAFEKGVDCANCHGDLIRGEGIVPQERCSVCHNRSTDLARITDREFIHKKHVTDHKIDCMDCHLRIEHSIDQERLNHAASDCQSCHPDHHGEQISMLQGKGGRSIPVHTNSMVAARIACPSCHQVKQVSATGTVLWKASITMCTQCHEESDTERFQTYRDTLEKAVGEIEADIQRVREALKKAKLPEERSAAAAKQLDDFQADVDFLKAANGIHNVHYATTLTRSVVELLSTLCRELQIDEPKINLPEEADPSK